jgi:Trypsin-like peptidase domain
MDSRLARKLFAQHASAMAFIEVETPDGSKGSGSAFHVGDGVFVTARHVVEGRQVCEVKITEPIAIATDEYFRDILKIDVSDDYIRQYDEKIGAKPEAPVLWKSWLRPLEIADGPYFAKEDDLDVAVFRVNEIHHAVGVVRLGVHWDDWVYRGLWNLSDAIVLGYPPIPMVNEPRLIAARAEIHTFVTPRHVSAIHFLLSAIPRGGFSGGVAIQENGDALGVVTSSLTQDSLPEQLGFFAVLSVEAIVKCLGANGLYPKVQSEYHKSKLDIDPGSVLKEIYGKDNGESETQN